MVKKGICEYFNKSCGANTVENYEEPMQSPVEQPPTDPNFQISEKFNQTCKIHVILSDSCPHCQNFVNDANNYNLQYTRVEQSQEALFKEMIESSRGGVPCFKITCDQFGSIKISGYGGSLMWLHEEVSKKAQVPGSVPPVGGGSQGMEGGHAINQAHGVLKCWVMDGCPWCTKIKSMFDENNVQYEIMSGPPPGPGNGVPQVQSSTTGKVCVGYRDIDGIMNELN